ncbi:hypothetical protein PR048_006365 [Dryococelus australis]|uniref:Uncharacterized protein n=1 Tax=Dryococelus australis TaxID=614101 RepID=A0ABQ9IAS6_9NEOP|nr:hypothetical protein PR048_006365 [Dryococelus australis]
MRVIEGSMEQRRNERVGETGDHRENPLTNGIVRHDSHMRKSGNLQWLDMAFRSMKSRREKCERLVPEIEAGFARRVRANKTTHHAMQPVTICSTPLVEDRRAALAVADQSSRSKSQTSVRIPEAPRIGYPVFPTCFLLRTAEECLRKKRAPCISHSLLRSGENVNSEWKVPYTNGSDEASGERKRARRKIAVTLMRGLLRRPYKRTQLGADCLSRSALKVETFRALTRRRESYGWVHFPSAPLPRNIMSYIPPSPSSSVSSSHRLCKAALLTNSGVNQINTLETLCAEWEQPPEVGVWWRVSEGGEGPGVIGSSVNFKVESKFVYTLPVRTKIMRIPRVPEIRKDLITYREITLRVVIPARHLRVAQILRLDQTSTSWRARRPRRRSNLGPSRESAGSSWDDILAPTRRPGCRELKSPFPSLQTSTSAPHPPSHSPRLTLVDGSATVVVFARATYYFRGIPINASRGEIGAALKGAAYLTRHGTGQERANAKGDTGTRIKCRIATMSEALN